MKLSIRNQILLLIPFNMIDKIRFNFSLTIAVLFFWGCFGVATAQVLKQLPTAENITHQQKNKIHSQLETRLFIENKGQFDAPGETNPILFQCDADGYRIAISKKGLHYYFLKNENNEISNHPAISNPLVNPTQTATKGIELPNLNPKSELNTSKKRETIITSYRVDVSLINSSSPKKITTENPGNSYYNYYFGNNEFAQVRGYQKIRMHEVYPGIDWVIYMKDGKVKYDFEIAQNHTSLNLLQLEFKGATNLSILSNGNLKITTPLGEIIEEKPISFQGSKEINTQFVLNLNNIGFKFDEPLDPKQPLTIDPCVKWARYFGGNSNDYSVNIDIDNSGNIYLTGQTNSTNIATTGAYQTSIVSNPDCFLAKFNSSADLLWATYMGGNSTDLPLDLVVDKSNNRIYIVGNTYSTTNISTTNGYQPSLAGVTDGFMVQFSASGDRNWGSYFGGTSDDIIHSATVDNNGNFIVGGYTTSSAGISTTGSFQSSYSNGYDGFLSKFNSSGALQWSTYVGGGGFDQIFAITTGSNNEIYITGETYSTNNISTSGTHQTSLKGNGYYTDCFIMRFATTGSRAWGTYFGGPSREKGNAIHCSADGSILVTGFTFSTSDIASTSSYQTTGYGYNGYTDAFLLKLNNSGTRSWSTYVGGVYGDNAYAVTSDASNRIFLAVETNNSGFGTNGSHQSTIGGSSDLCLFRFASTGTFQWATYYGGSAGDFPHSMVSDASGAVYLAGLTTSSNGIAFGYSSTLSTSNGDYDAFIVKFQDGAETTISKTNVNACPFASQSLSATKTGNSYSWNTGATTASINVYNQANYKVTTTSSLGCKFTDSFFVKRFVLDTTAKITQNNFFCQTGQPITLTFNYSQPVNSLSWRNTSWTNLGSGQQISVNQAGNYNMIVRYSTNNCFDTISYNLKQQVFNVTIPKTGNITCGGSYGVEISHNAQGTTPPTYSWTPTTTMTASSYGRALLYPTANTKYILSSSVGGYCTTNDTIDVTVTNSTAPKIQRTYDSIQCYGNTFFAFNPQFNNNSGNNRFSKLSPVSMYPALPDLNDTVTIIYNANFGNTKLKSASAVYIYTGMITSLSETDNQWKHIRGNLTTAEAQYKMTSMGGGLWKITLPIKSFYGKTEPFVQGEIGRKLAFIFHNASGTIKGAGMGDLDIFYPMYNPATPTTATNQVQATVPYAGNDNRYVVEIGEIVPVFIATGEKMSQITLTVGSTSRTVYNTDTVSLFHKVTGSFNVQVYYYKNTNPVINANYHYPIYVSAVNLTSSNSYKWDYGDGNTTNSYNLNPVYKSYTDAGTYTIKMDVTAGNGCTYTQAQTKVVVRPKAAANITLPSSPFCLNEDFKPSASSSTILGGTGSLAYSWDFGDGTKSTSTNPTKRYSTQGGYNVKLRATGTNICADSTTRFISIRPQPPVNITSSSQYGCLNGTTLEATSGFSSYSWNTGQNSPTIFAFSAGSFDVEATTNYGCISTNSIKLLEHPGIQISTDNGQILCKPTDKINLTATSGFTNYEWNTGSNSRYTTASNPGTYVVTAFDGACQITNSISIEDGSYINPSIIYTPIAPMTCIFTPKSNLGEYYSWSMGDGNVSIEKNPEHTYAKDGEYLVCLDIMNKCKVRNSFCGTLSVPFSTSSRVELKKAELKIYPNPGTGTYWIDLNNTEPLTSITITDMKGAIIYYKEKYNVNERIQISCANGMYLVKVQTNNHVFTGKINHSNN